jgi:hypothetical protein
MSAEEFDWLTAPMEQMYPSVDVLAEIGRVAIAAAPRRPGTGLGASRAEVSHSVRRTDQAEQLSPHEAVEGPDRRILPGQDAGNSLKGLAIVRERLEARHSVMHSIWTLEDRQRLFEAGALQSLQSQEELDELVRECGASAKWRTLHPKENAPGPRQ